MQGDGKYAGTWSATIEGAASSTPTQTGQAVRATATPAATEEEAKARVQKTMRGLDPNSPQSLNAVEELVAVGPKGVATLIQELGASEVLRRWAASYALSRLSETGDIPKLSAGLKDSNLTVRTIIAATMLKLGNRDGVAILREAASSTETDAFSEPSQLLRDYARTVLAAYEKGAQNIPASESNQDMVQAAPGAEGKSDPPEAHSDPSMGYARTSQAVHATGGFIRHDSPGPRYRLAQWEPDDVSLQGEPPQTAELVFGDRGVVIKLNIEFDGPGATPKLLETWKQGIEKMWSNRISWKPGVPAKVEVNYRVLSPTDLPSPDYHYINVLSLKPGEKHRSFVSKIPKKGDSVSGEWGSDDSALVAAHEAGHLLGIEDEYVDTPIRDTGQVRSVPRKEFMGEAVGIPSIMWQAWPDDNGVAPEAKPRHSKAVWTLLGVDPDDFPQMFAVTGTPAPAQTTAPSKTATTAKPTPSSTVKATPSPRPTSKTTPPGKKWTLVKTSVNPLNAPLRPQDLPGPPEITFNETMWSYHTSLAGATGYDVVFTVYFTRPPAELIAGQTVPITITPNLGGTNPNPNIARTVRVEVGYYESSVPPSADNATRHKESIQLTGWTINGRDLQTHETTPWQVPADLWKRLANGSTVVQDEDLYLFFEVWNGDNVYLVVWQYRAEK